jgi:hypothetical protein
MNSSTDHSSTPHLFLNAQFETPSAYDEATRTNTNQESGTSVTSTPTTVIERHCFDVSNCQEAVIGLGKSVEPIKVCCLGSVVFLCTTCTNKRTAHALSPQRTAATTR